MMEAAKALLATFDLICVGTSNVGNEKSLSSINSPLYLQFRIDTAARKWCEGDCKQTYGFVGMSDTIFILESMKEGRNSVHRSISRETGKYFSASLIGSGRRAESAQCETAPYSGMPTPKF